MDGDGGPVAFVTEAGSGIGRSVAVTLARAGHAVGVFDRDRSGAAETVEAIEQTSTSPAIALAGDVSVRADLEDAVATLHREFGAITAGVANAGIWSPGALLDLTDAEWERAVQINLTGTFLTAQVLMAQMVHHGSGSFVAVASDVGVQGSQGCAAYVATKHAVVGLIRSMALDYGPLGVRSNAVCPGFVDTPLAREVFANQDESILASRMAEQPMGRFATPEEVADLVAFLLGPNAGFVNGAAVLCDGGSSSGYFHSTSIHAAQTPASHLG